MTFKDLKKRVSLEEETTRQQSRLLFDRLRNKPFWICDIEKHKQQDTRTKGDCCFNHIIGLPKDQEGIEKPVFYKIEIYKCLQSYTDL